MDRDDCGEWLYWEDSMLMYNPKLAAEATKTIMELFCTLHPYTKTIPLALRLRYKSMPLLCPVRAFPAAAALRRKHSVFMAFNLA